MSSRRKKNENLLGSVVVLVMVVVFLLTFQSTKSFGVAGFAAGIVFAIAFVILIFIRQAQEEKLKRSGIHDIDKMTGRQFELYLGHLIRSQGYAVEVTRSAGDFGADLVIKKNDKKIVVQAKRHSKNVGIKAVQEAYGSMPLYGASEAWVITNSNFTDAAHTLAKSNNVRLIDRKELIEMVLKMNPQSVPNPKKVIAQNPEIKLSCDRCGKPMVLRKGSKGEFYGCSGYPKCRNTKVV